MRNPVRLLKIYRRADKVVEVMDESAKRPALYKDAGYLTRLLAALRGLWLELPLPDEVKNMRFLQAILKNWKTTLAGVALLATTAQGIANDPATVFEKDTLAKIVIAVGLVAGKDADKTGVPPKTTP